MLFIYLYTIIVIEKAHEDGIWKVCWIPQANVIVTGSVDETIKVWYVKIDIRVIINNNYNFIVFHM